MKIKEIEFYMNEIINAKIKQAFWFFSNLKEEINNVKANNNKND